LDVFFLWTLVTRFSCFASAASTHARHKMSSHDNHMADYSFVQSNHDDKLEEQ